jgi:fructoselysine 6-kinase
LSQDTSVNPGADGLALAFASAGDGRSEAESVGRALLARGAGLAIVTMGRGGAMALGEGETAWVAARPVSVLDTLGAGDSFAAGFIAARLGGAALRECLEAGAAAAAAACAHWGGFPQTLRPA